MTSESLTCVVRYIHQLAETPAEHERSDADLLHTFLAERDEMAFRLLMQRHGRMVLSVCRRMLRQREDAEDAFQAVFLILARNAASIQKRASLASWLYGVAYRTSLKARAEMSKRRQHEKQAAQARQVQSERDVAMRELQAVLTEEVARLAEKYRAPFVLCCLEGMSRSEAARQLGWKEGTVSGRLAEARKRLQTRLQHRGITLTAALCASAVSASAEAAAPPLLLRTTMEAALGIAAGRAAKGVVSAPVAALVDGATRALFLSKVKLACFVLAVAGLVAAAAGSQFHRLWANLAEGEPSAPAADKPAGKKPAATAKEEDDKIVLHGRVLDPDSKPLAGATVFFLPTADEGDSQKEPPSEVKSGAEGRFRFAVDRSHLKSGRWLAAAAEGYALDWIDADKLGPGEITLRLVKDLPITGRILTLEGRPVKGASIQVKEVEAPPEGDLSPVLRTIQRDGNRVFTHPLRYCTVGTGARFLTPVKTDEQGRFRLTGLGKERIVRLWVEGPAIEHQILYVLTRPKLNVKELVESAPDRIGLLMRLPAIYGPTFEHLVGPTKPISGMVRERVTGKPLPDVWINGSVRIAWWENYVKVKTDKEGRYRILGLPKARSYHVSVWGLQKNYLQVGKTVGDSEGLAPITLDFELVHGVRVSGRITDKATGKPVPAALWYVPLENNKHFGALPGADNGLFAGLGHRNEKDGSFNLLAPPGPGIIRVRAEVEHNPYTEAALDPVDLSKAASADPEGSLGVTFLGAGGIYLTLSGHNSYRIIDPAADASSLTCDFTFDRGGTRTGTVVEPEGKPLTGVHVQGLSAMGGAKVLTDSSFKAIALNPAHPRTIAFAHKERKLVGAVRLGGDEKEPVRVRLQLGAVLTGRVLDEDGKPSPGVAVGVSYRLNAVRWLADEVAGNRPIQTDANGRFRIEGVFPDQKFGLALSKGKGFLSTDEKYGELTVSVGTKDLGDIIAKRSE